MDVVALGELLIDFTCSGTSGQGNWMYEANPGGAPCNVLSMLQKLEHSTAFIGKVGKDSFGSLLENAIKEQGIHAGGLVYDETVPTTLAFVHTGSGGERDFSFYRNPGADMMLKQEEIDEGLISQAKIFHFGSLSMTSGSVCQATEYAVGIAKKNNVLVSFDPNLRPPLWDNLDMAKEKMKYGFSQCDILKISDNEIEFITGMDDIEEGVIEIIKQYHIPFVCATMGRDGSKVFYNGSVTTGKPFHSDKTVETTGAGDTFCGCMLHFILKYGIDGFTPESLEDMLSYANAAACLVTTRKGALRVMPSVPEIKSFMEHSQE